MKVNRNWLNTMGIGARVMVLDTGCDPDVHVRVSEYRVTAGMDRKDYSRHGTTMCRLIASRDPCNLGMAPYCTLAACKCIGAGLIPIRDALEWAVTWEADVVSMSFAYGVVDGAISARLKQLDDRGTICLAAYNSRLLYPNQHDGVIPVGQLNGSRFRGVQTHARAPRVAGDGPGEEWKGSSISTALMAGVAACAKAFDKTINRERFLLEVGEGDLTS